MNIEEIKGRIKKLEPSLIEIRRDLHAHPEKGFEEYRTSKIINEWLQMYNIPVKTGIAGTGLVAMIEGNSAGPTIGVRVDIDAVLVEDKKKVPYASQFPGLAHACGHDVHTVIGLGLGKILSELKNNLHGNVKLIFQASEELPKRNSNAEFDVFREAPVGKRGAYLAIKEGVLENPKVDGLIGIHCWPNLKAGEIGYQYGPTMSGTGNFHIEILGKGAHAATPHKSIDSISIASQVINALQTIVSRKVDPTYPLVLTIGTIKGGSRRSVICDRVDMTGTVRSLEPKILQDTVPKLMNSIIKSITEGNGGKYVLNYGVDQPPVVNDDFMVDLAAKALSEMLDNKAIELKDAPMTAEDFSFMSKLVPSVYLKLGTSNDQEGTNYPLHNSNFDVDESCITAGILAVLKIIFEFLESGGLND